MASKVIYSVVAVVGIVSASTFAWWYQNSPKSTETTQAAGGAPGGPKMVGVEVTKVQKLLLRLVPKYNHHPRFVNRHLGLLIGQE